VGSDKVEFQKVKHNWTTYTSTYWHLCVAGTIRQDACISEDFYFAGLPFHRTCISGLEYRDLRVGTSVLGLLIRDLCIGDSRTCASCNRMQDQFAHVVAVQGMRDLITKALVESERGHSNEIKYKASMSSSLVTRTNLIYIMTSCKIMTRRERDI